jgi:glutamate-1-semialdehyde 2,1-aminomutase
MQRRGEEIAAVIFEPVAGNMGCVVPSDAFLEALRRTSEAFGTLLICDEVMTGFRVARGGAQSRFSWKPDLTTLGKIVGGGLPIGAYGGRADVMDYVLPAGKVFQAGTLSGNPLATAAGIAMLNQLRDHPPYDRLEQLAARLADGLVRAATDADMPHTLVRVGSMMTLFFNPEPVTHWEIAARCDTTALARYFRAMLDRGIYLPPSQYEALFVSAAHTESDIDATVDAAHVSLAAARAGQ